VHAGDQRSRERSACSLEPGKDFEIVTVSFDPRDTPATATAKKAVYLDRYKRPAAAAWHFLTGDPASIAKLTRAAGFRYVWDDRRSSSRIRPA
jgi:protein SCO1/2